MDSDRKKWSLFPDFLLNTAAPRVSSKSVAWLIKKAALKTGGEPLSAILVRLTC